MFKKKKRTDEYFIINKNNMAPCLIYKEILSVFKDLKDYNLKRHAEICCQIWCISRKDLLRQNSGTEKHQASQQFFKRSNTSNRLLKKLIMW